MTDEYLWDRSGEPDAELEQLELVMASVAFRPRPALTLPDHRPPRVESAWRRDRHVLGVALLSAAATLLLIASWQGLFGGTREIILREVPAPAVGPAPESAASVPAPQPPMLDTDERLETSDEPSDDEHAEPRSERTLIREPDKPQGPTTTSGEAELTVEDILLGRPLPHGDERSHEPPLPERLTTQQIRRAFAPVTAEARACGGKHGALPTTRVEVRMTVHCATGRVIEAEASGMYRSTPLGKCVAKALSRARFPACSRDTFGLSYTIVMRPNP